MSVNSNLVLPEKYTNRVTPYFSSIEDYYKTRDTLCSEIKPKIEELYEKRRKSEEAAQIKRYR